jgi:hypothetical protein
VAKRIVEDFRSDAAENLGTEEGRITGGPMAFACSCGSSLLFTVSQDGREFDEGIALVTWIGRSNMV